MIVGDLGLVEWCLCVFMFCDRRAGFELDTLDKAFYKCIVQEKRNKVKEQECSNFQTQNKGSGAFEEQYDSLCNMNGSYTYVDDVK